VGALKQVPNYANHRVGSAWSWVASDAETSGVIAIRRIRGSLYGRLVPLSILLAALLSVLGGAAEASHYRRQALAFIAAGLVALLAALRPNIYVFALGALLLVPYTWSPTLINAPAPAVMLFALPAAIAAVVALVRRGRLRLCILDGLVIAIFVSSIVSEIAVGAGSEILGSHTLSHNKAEVLILPYFAFRLVLAAWPQAMAQLPRAFMAVGAGLAVIAILEAVTHTNLFAHSSLNNPGLAVWERTYPRAGAIRAAATMGHPIALGSFLIIPLVIAFARRNWGIFALLAIGEALTLSRGPYIATFAALILCSFLTRKLGRLIAIVVLVAAAGVFIGPVRNSVINSFQTGTKEAKTVTYRSNLIGTSLASLTVWGKPTGRTDELFTQQSEGSLADVTSEFALMTGRQGVGGLAIWMSFLAAFIYVIRLARRRADSLLLFLGVALVAEWIALISVALITSFQYAFWLTVAMVATRISIGARPGEPVQSPEAAKRLARNGHMPMDFRAGLPAMDS
jgi:hypothetical protein